MRQRGISLPNAPVTEGFRVKEIEPNPAGIRHGIHGVGGPIEEPCIDLSRVILENEIRVTVSIHIAAEDHAEVAQAVAIKELCVEAPGSRGRVHGVSRPVQEPRVDLSHVVLEDEIRNAIAIDVPGCDAPPVIQTAVENGGPPPVGLRL